VARGDLAVSVQDDGKGLPDTVQESGLRNLRARAVELGGTLDVRAAEGGGTRLHWQVPLHDA